MDRRSQLDEEDEERTRRRQARRKAGAEERGAEERRSGRSGRRQATDIKSNNPHLAGGELKIITTLNRLNLHRCVNSIAVIRLVNLVGKY